MTPEQKALLEQKRALLTRRLIGKSERENIERLPDRLPPDVAGFLQAADKHFSDKGFEILVPWYFPDIRIDSDGWYKGDDRPPDYFYKQFGWEEKRITALGKYPESIN